MAAVEIAGQHADDVSPEPRRRTGLGYSRDANVSRALEGRHRVIQLPANRAQLGPGQRGGGGVAVVPVFAVGRAQAILHSIAKLKAQGDIPHGLPIFLDSPMAVHTTALFKRHMGEHRLSAEEVQAMDHVATMIETPEQSKALIKRHGPMVILAASGMATGGRVLHHLANYVGHHRNMVILTGFQSPGTRGATLASGAPTLRLHGKDMPVAAEIVQLTSASAHADGNQLLAWLQKMPQAPEQVYVVHGELEASDTLRQRIERELGMRAVVPEHASVWPA